MPELRVPLLGMATVAKTGGFREDMSELPPAHAGGAASRAHAVRGNSAIRSVGRLTARPGRQRRREARSRAKATTGAAM